MVLWNLKPRIHWVCVFAATFPGGDTGNVVVAPQLRVYSKHDVYVIYTMTVLWPGTLSSPVLCSLRIIEPDPNSVCINIKLQVCETKPNACSLAACQWERDPHCHSHNYHRHYHR